MVCAFLPALRVCGHADAPITFFPCYAAYFGGVGIAIIALTRNRVLVNIGVAIALLFWEATLGGVTSLLFVDHHSRITLAICGVTIAIAIRIVWWLVRATLSERTLAGIAIIQGLVSAAWAGMLVCDPDGLWGSTVTLVAGVTLMCAGAAWHRSIPLAAPLPVATLM